MKRIKKTSFWTGEHYFCPHCNKKVGLLDKFCGYCGTGIEWERCPCCNYNTEYMKGDFCQNCGVAPIRRDK